MILDEIKKYIRQLELADKFSDSLKLNIMKTIKEEYDRRKTSLGQSPISKSMANELAQLPPFFLQGHDVLSRTPLTFFMRGDDIPQVHGTWNNLMKYLEDRNNAGKTLHAIIKEVIEQTILDNHPSIRYKTSHVSNVGMHRFNIFAKTISSATITGVSRESLRQDTAVENFLCGSLDFIAVMVCSPFILVKGIFNAAIRKPLNITKQKALFNKLKLITNPRDQKLIISNVVEKYKKIFYRDDLYDSRSDSSKDLYDTLSSRIYIIQSKWNSLVSYIGERDRDYLKHNGKKLFNCINEVVSNYEIPDAQAARTFQHG